MLPPTAYAVSATSSPAALMREARSSAQAIVQNMQATRRASEEEQAKTAPSKEDLQEIAAARNLSGIMRREAKSGVAEKAEARSVKDNLYKVARKYFPVQQEKSGKYLVRNTINGVPVVPPGMTGRELDQFIEHTSAGIQERHAKTLVFISLSMPETLLRRMFAADWRDRKLRDRTVFVLRGWPSKPQGLPQMLAKIVRLFPRPSEQPTVEVDPLLFTGHHIDRVPVVLHEAPGGKWGAIVGDGYGLTAAIQRIDQGKGSDHKVFGRTWKIQEPNLIEVIDQRAKVYPWKRVEHHALERSLSRQSTELAVSLPQSKRIRDYLWNPSIVANQTLRLPDGQVVVRKGQKINPLNYVRDFPFGALQKFVVFNPAEPWQVRQVEAWVGTYSQITLMATRLPDTSAGYRALVEDFHHPVYAANALLDAKLGVHWSPSLVGIDDKRLRIMVPAIPRYAPPPVAGGRP